MPRTRRKRSSSATWRRPRNMSTADWEHINEKTEAEMIAWARGLIVEDEHGRPRKLTDHEVLAIAKAGQWEGSSRAARKRKKHE